MHGRKKTSEEVLVAESEAIKKKIHTYQTLTSILFERRKNHEKIQDSLDLTSKMLLSNPDFYTMWNIRRELLISQHETTIGLSMSIPIHRISSDHILGASIRDIELSLSVDCIRRNPKSYCAWYHRQWILQRFDINHEDEFQLCKDFLKIDQRNFHCWSYRRFLVNFYHTSIDKEVNYSEEKILENFSNYSAFHHRCIFITKIAHESIQTTIETELKTIENAVFTEPDDQSAWWYLHFLLQWAKQQITRKKEVDKEKDEKDKNDEIDIWYGNMLEKQYISMKELMEIEPNCKWIKTALVSILTNLIEKRQQSSPSSSSMKEDATTKTFVGHRCSLLEELRLIDPAHRLRYEYILNNSS